MKFLLQRSSLTWTYFSLNKLNFHYKQTVYIHKHNNFLRYSIGNFIFDLSISTLQLSYNESPS
jgi:hypothetical protein